MGRKNLTKEELRQKQREMKRMKEREKEQRLEEKAKFEKEMEERYKRKKLEHKRYRCFFVFFCIAAKKLTDVPLKFQRVKYISSVLLDTLKMLHVDVFFILAIYLK